MLSKSGDDIITDWYVFDGAKVTISSPFSFFILINVLADWEDKNTLTEFYFEEVLGDWTIPELPAAINKPPFILQLES